MTNITNAKIEKAKTDIAKTKAKIAEFQARLREQEKLLRHFEDLEIVAEYRRNMASDKNLGEVYGRKPILPTASAAAQDKEDIVNAETEIE